MSISFNDICIRQLTVEFFMNGVEPEEIAKHSGRTKAQVILCIRETLLWKNGNGDLSLMPWGQCLRARERQQEAWAREPQLSLDL